MPLAILNRDGLEALIHRETQSKENVSAIWLARVLPDRKETTGHTFTAKLIPNKKATMQIDSKQQHYITTAFLESQLVYRITSIMPSLPTPSNPPSIPTLKGFASRNESPPPHNLLPSQAPCQILSTNSLS